MLMEKTAAMAAELAKDNRPNKMAQVAENITALTGV